MENLIFNFQFSIFNSCCVRDWSGILCERLGTMGFGSGDGIGGNLGVGRNDASKDIAESPAALPNAQKRQPTILDATSHVPRIFAKLK